MKIIDKNIAEQTRGIFRAPTDSAQANEWRDIPSEKGSQQVLSDAEILELSELILKIEKHYGFPCDIEWAREGGKFYIVQSRPITTLQTKTGEHDWLNKHQWYLFEKIPNAPLWFTHSPFVAYRNELHDRYGMPFFHGFYIFHDGYLAMYHVIGEMERAGKELLDKELRDEKIISDILAEIGTLSEKLFVVAEQIQNTGLISDTQVGRARELFEKAYRVHEELWIRGQAINCLEHGYSLVGDKLRQALISDGVEECLLENVFSVITTPDKYSNLQKEEQALKGLVIKGGESGEGLVSHWKRFAWLGYNWFGPAYEIDYFRNRFNEYRQEGRDIQVLDESEFAEDIRVKKEKLINEYNLSVKTIHLSNIASEIIYQKAYRVDASWSFYWRVENIFNYVAEKICGVVDDVHFLLPEEIIEVLSGNHNDYTNSRFRREASVFYFKDGVSKECVHKQAELFIDYFNSLERRAQRDSGSVKSDSLSGQCGNPGQSIGIVRIVETINDMKKMLEGDILVSHMTSPALMTAIKRAGAIVTDIGGITCHAAIVSRELKKPCIIGTKIATQVLHDGDLVEVDADKGVVRILERAGIENGDAQNRPIATLQNTPYLLQQNVELSKYQKLFHLSGLPFLVNDLLMQNYAHHDALFMFDGKLWESYLPSTTVDQLKREGLRFYGNLPAVHSWIADFEHYKREAIQFFVSTLDVNLVTKAGVKQYFAHVAMLHKFYIKTEFFYTDAVYEEATRNILMSDAQDIISRIKQEWREYLTEVYFGNSSYVHRIVQLLGITLHLSPDDLYQCTVSELLGLFDGRVLDRDLLIQRTRGYITLGTWYPECVLVGAAANKFFLDLHASQVTNNDILKGTTAFRGTAKGRVRVFYEGYGTNVIDRERFERTFATGDVLVVDTTSPRMQLLASRASAVVADQGGMLSHAAIVSRELKKPCIIGTKIATQVLHDGDLVEVDADNGVVRVLERVAQ